MFNDNIYPNNGQDFSSSLRQGLKKKDPKNEDEILQQVPVIKQVVRRLDEKIAFYSSVDAIPAELHTKPEEFMHAFAANRLTVENLKAERMYIAARLKNLE